MKRLASAVACVLVVLCGCSASLQPLKGEKDLRDEIAEPAFWEEVARVAQLTDGSEPAPAVCWLSDGRTSITYDSGNFTTTESRRVKLVVLDAKRAEWYLNVAIPTSNTRRVSNIKARTILKDGTCVSLKSDDIHERSRFPDYVLYADQTEKVFAMPAVEDGCIVEYEYTRSDEGADFEDHYFFEMSIPVRKANYTFSMPMDFVTNGLNINSRAYGSTPRAVHGSSLTAEGQLTSLSWTKENLRAIESEPCMPPLDEVASRIAVGLGESRAVGKYTWEVLGKHYFASALEPYVAKDIDGLPSVAMKWCGGAQTASEKIEAIGNAVAEKIRYVAIELEDSGWTPQHPTSTVSARYGDCKDMSVLTVALLHSLGVPAWPALLATRSSGTVDTLLVTPSVMNHMIVYARTADGDCWIDPTGGNFQLGELPSEDRGAHALVLTDKGCFFRKIPDSAAERNRIEKRMVGKLKADGSLSAELVEEYHGDIALTMRGVLDGMSSQDAKEALERSLEDTYGDVRVTDWRCVTSGDPRPCRIIAQFESDNCGQRSGGNLIIDGSVLGPQRLERQLPDEHRWHHVVFDHAYVSNESVEIELPRGWRADALPGDVNLTTDYGTFLSESSDDEGVLRSFRSFRLGTNRVDCTFYKRLRGFLSEVDDAQSEPIVLTQR
ncbi:MAG: DUF3857 and transglutaminase domain-containing protein [Candidatus Eisenbacteria bacterium]